jgi:hypothetical protein
MAGVNGWYSAIGWNQAGMESTGVKALEMSGSRILGPGTPAANCLEKAARFLDFVGESLTRAAEQAREVLYTNAETTSGGTAKPRSDRG